VGDPTEADWERITLHAAPEKIREELKAARAQRTRAENLVTRWEVMLARRLQEVAEGTWPPDVECGLCGNPRRPRQVKRLLVGGEWQSVCTHCRECRRCPNDDGCHSDRYLTGAGACEWCGQTPGETPATAGDGDE
jgi:hypothetical protein